MFLKSQWTEWARDWGLTHGPEKGLFYRKECVVGERKGLLIRAGWGPQENPGLVVWVRFPGVADLDRLRQALIDDVTLDVLPGKGSARRKMAVLQAGKKTIRFGEQPEFALNASSLHWHRKFPFRSPKPAQIQAWVDALVAAIARVTPGFDGRCELCGTGAARQFVLVDGLPTMMCSNCQQRLASEGEMADRAYDMKEARHLSGAFMAFLAALAGAIAWAGIAALTNRIFAAAAIGIGAMVAWAYRRGADRVDVAGRVIAAFLTVVSVVIGEILLMTWWVAKANPEIGFNPDAGWYVYMKTWQEHPGEEVLPLFLGLVGAWVASQMLQRPKLKATIETANAAEAGRNRAA